ncbi:ATP-dependent RNA helicase ddx23-like [Aphis gossypii]|uniref:ATP-dependent RNA helicase ddx23-like n=1 Tax=Aphis gossypii TaxID=80765 RepID=UPI002158DE74|nr:ATP-dependent RNA helicase ddx23-like [Aphis gossypii]
MTDRKRNLQMTPDYFTGNEDVKKFLKQYSMITDFNNWDEKDKLKFLPMFVKGTASNFLDNLNNLKTNWTWKEIEDAFIDQYLPIDYTTILKTNLENRRQGESESATSFMTEIEKNLKKYELMQHRINNRGPTINNYTDLLNLQVTKLQEFHKNKEIKKNEEHTENLLLKIEQLTEEVKRMNMLGKNTNRSVDFRENRYYDDYEDKSYYRNNETRGRDYNRNKDYYRKPEYRYKSPYPGRSRESSRDSRRYNRNRSFSRDNQRRNRDRSYSRERPDSREQSYTRESQRDNYKRQDSRDRQSRSRTPEQYRNKDKQKEMRGEMENITCYKCERRGHYATQCDNVEECEVKLSSENPTFQAPYRVSPAQREKLRLLIDEMIRADIIEPSKSNYAAPVFLIPKKQKGEYRFW